MSDRFERWKLCKEELEIIEDRIFGEFIPMVCMTETEQDEFDRLTEQANDLVWRIEVLEDEFDYSETLLLEMYEDANEATRHQENAIYARYGTYAPKSIADFWQHI